MARRGVRLLGWGIFEDQVWKIGTNPSFGGKLTRDLIDLWPEEGGVEVYAKFYGAPLFFNGAQTIVYSITITYRINR